MKNAIFKILCLFVCIMTFASCKDSFRDTYYVYDSRNDDGNIHVFAHQPSRNEPIAAASQWKGYTVVNFADKKDIYERGPYILVTNTETSQSGWILKDCIHIYREDGKWDRAGNFYKQSTADALDEAGSKWSGFIMRYIDYLQFERCKYNESLWLWLYMGAGLLTALLAFGFYVTAGDGGLIPAILYFLLWASVIFLFYAQYVAFGIHSPFAPTTVAESSSSGGDGSWLLGLIGFVLLLVAVGAQALVGPMMLGTLLPGADSMGDNAERVQVNVLCHYIPLIIWGICIWLFKGVADYVLFAMLGGQAIYSVYLLVMGIIRGGFFQTLFYVILFPVALAVFLMVALSFGLMVGIMVAIVFGGLSVFTQPIVADSGEEVYSLRDACGIEVDEIDRFGNSTRYDRHYSRGFGGWFRDR